MLSSSRARRPRLVAPVVASLLALACAGGWVWSRFNYGRFSVQRWSLEEAYTVVHLAEAGLSKGRVSFALTEVRNTRPNPRASRAASTAPTRPWWRMNRITQPDPNFNRYDAGDISDDAVTADFAGFGIAWGDRTPQRSRWKTTGVTVAVPFWALTSLAGLLALLAWRRWCRWSIAERLGTICPTCGYDVRATPERCPECGTPIPAPAPASLQRVG